MAYQAILSALADPTRRSVLDRLREGPLSVAKIAAPLPVSRAAVSQHLKVLLSAGLVTKTDAGSRNMYAIAPGGAKALVAWLGDLVEERAAPEGGMRREVVVPMTPERAWSMLIEDFAMWWPVGQVSVSARESGALPMTVAMDAVVGGQIVESGFDGGDHVWATVTALEPGASVTLDWAFAVPGQVTLAVARDAEGARVSVEHSDEAAVSLWDLVLVERFGAAARAGISNF